MKLTDFVVPTVMAGILVYGLFKGVDVFHEFLDGAAEYLKSSLDILPALLALMTAVQMFQASGGLDVITNALSPLTERLGFPAECVPLALIRPVSGSGALAVYENILSRIPADSYAARVASVLMGSTETTFYTITVYFSVTQVKNTRYVLLCALAADITGFFLSSLMVRSFFS